MEKLLFDLDPQKCTACCACVLACMDQNDIDSAHGQHPLRNALELEGKNKDGTPVFSYLSVGCMHCEDAPCVMSCPVGCLWKDTETGLTLYNNAACIGCHSCAMACPFGAPSFGADGRMIKCDGCIDRLRAGMIPACVRVCPTGALTCQPKQAFHQMQTEKSLRALLGLR